jgi:hypothetical protein
MTASAADAVLIGGDLVHELEQLAAEATDPAERERLDAELDEALGLLERAHERAEAERRREVRSRQIDRHLEARDLLAQPGLRRRHMTARQKSLVLRNFGWEVYMSIKW